MAAPRVLVVHFSRTGRTRLVADAIVHELGADAETIDDPTPRQGRLGYLRCSREALTGRLPDVAPSGRAIEAYDLVLVGTPVWNASPSSPARAFLAGERARLARVGAIGFFLSHGGFGAARTFAMMEAIAGRAPRATLAIRRRHFAAGEVVARVRGFAAVVGVVGARR